MELVRVIGQCELNPDHTVQSHNLILLILRFRKKSEARASVIEAISKDSKRSLNPHMRPGLEKKGAALEDTELDPPGPQQC